MLFQISQVLRLLVFLKCQSRQIGRYRWLVKRPGPMVSPFQCQATTPLTYLSRLSEWRCLCHQLPCILLQPWMILTSEWQACQHSRLHFRRPHLLPTRASGTTWCPRSNGLTVPHLATFRYLTSPLHSYQHSLVDPCYRHQHWTLMQKNSTLNCRSIKPLWVV
jgi:hypothetical protein